LLDPPEMVAYTKIKDSPEPWNTDKDRDVSRRLALESVVLLKNENNILPLDKNKIKSIAVIGPLGRFSALGLVRRHAALCDHSFAGDQRPGGARTSK
jgi:hypothetical protein